MASPIKPIEEYQAAYEAYSKEFLEAVAEKVAETVDTFLISYGEPKDYRQFRYFGTLVTDSIVLWLVTEGFAALSLDYVAGEEELTERAAAKAEREEKSAGRPDPGPSPLDRLPGAYL